MIAVAKITTERASELTAATTRLEMFSKLFIGSSLFLVFPLVGHSRHANYNADSVPVLKNGRILVFLTIYTVLLRLTDTECWYFLPIFGLVNSSGVSAAL